MYILFEKLQHHLESSLLYVHWNSVWYSEVPPIVLGKLFVTARSLILRSIHFGLLDYQIYLVIYKVVISKAARLNSCVKAAPRRNSSLLNKKYVTSQHPLASKWRFVVSPQGLASLKRLSLHSLKWTYNIQFLKLYFQTNSVI